MKEKQGKRGGRRNAQGMGRTEKCTREKRTTLDRQTEGQTDGQRNGQTEVYIEVVPT